MRSTWLTRKEKKEKKGKIYGRSRGGKERRRERRIDRKRSVLACPGGDELSEKRRAGDTTWRDTTRVTRWFRQTLQLARWKCRTCVTRRVSPRGSSSLFPLIGSANRKVEDYSAGNRFDCLRNVIVVSCPFHHRLSAQFAASGRIVFAGYHEKRLPRVFRPWQTTASFPLAAAIVETQKGQGFPPLGQFPSEEISSRLQRARQSKTLGIFFVQEKILGR